MQNLTIEQKTNLITRGLGETVGEEKIPEILRDRPLRIYWGTAPTGKPSVGYLVPMLKIADFLDAGCEVKILLADIHAFLDNMKSSWELLEERTKFYEFMIKSILELVDVPLHNLTFVRGSSYQLESQYSLDVYKMSALASVRDTKKAGAEVVKQLDTPWMSSLLYPILQAVDEEYLEVDAQFGGIDQRKIFMFAREFLPKLGYKKRIHLMNTLIPGLGKSGKMSSSEPNSKLDFDDSTEVIHSKIAKAFSVDGEVAGNGLLALMRHIVFHKLEKEQRSFVVSRPQKWGGDIEFSSAAELEQAFASGELSSVDLKPAVAKELDSLITPLRQKLEENTGLLKRAYPDT